MSDLRLKVVRRSPRSSFRTSFLVALTALAGMATPAVFAQTKPAAADDVLLPLCTPGIAPGMDLKSGLGLYELGGGLLGADLVDETAAAKCLKATSGNLSLDVRGVHLNLSGTVQYQVLGGPQRRIVASSPSPALCESFYTGNDQFALKLTNANGEDQGAGGLLGGVLSLSYSLGSRAITPQLSQATYGPWLACYDATVGNAAPVGAGPDAIFTASFENRADLVVEYFTTGGTPAEELTQTVNTDISYKARITNRGEATAQNVRVREFIPKASGLMAPSMSTVSCVRDADGQPCGGADGVLHQDQVALAPGESISYTLTRRVAGTAALPAESGAVTSVAAFVDPSQVLESRDADNSRRLRIGLNTLPTFAVGTSVPGGHGSLSPNTQQVVQGGTATFTLVPAAHYLVDTVTDNCGAGGSSAGTRTALQYNVPNITAACTVTASFVAEQFEVTSSGSGANGSITPASQMVSYGAPASFTVTPAAGYGASVTGCGGPLTNTGGDTWVTGAITGACNVSVTFSQNQYSVTASSSGNGTIAPPSQNIFHGGTATFTVVPAANYSVGAFGGTCPAPVNVGGSTYVALNITSSCTVVANFVLITHAVTVGSLSNGTINVANSPVTHGQAAQFTVTPATGYHLSGDPTGTAACGTITSAGGNNWTTAAITADGCQLSATFEINEYDVVVSMTGANGTIGDPPGTDPVTFTPQHGGSVSIAATPSTGYHAVFTTNSGTCSFTDANGDGTWESSGITADCEVGVTFVINTYTVTASVTGDNAGSTATPTSSPVNHGSFHFVNIAVAAGHHLGTVTHTCASGSLVGAGTPGDPGDPATYRVFVTGHCSVTAPIVAD